MSCSEEKVCRWKSPLLFCVAGLALWLAVYRWDYVEGRHARGSLQLLGLSFLAAAVGIFLSRRESESRQPATNPNRLWKVLLIACMAVHLVIATVLVRQSPGNVIDVYTIQTSAVQAFLKGIDPYTITQANIYDAEHTALFYPPGILVGSRLQFGFSYPPLVLLFAIPGYLLGDVRFSHIAAVLLSAWLMWRVGMNKRNFVIILLFLFNPLTFLVERYSWTDAFVLVTLCATVCAAVRRRWWLPIALGLFLCSKQYSVLALPFIPLLVDFDWKRTWKLVWQSLAVAGAVTIPFALWDFRHFYHDTVTFFVQSPARADSLSFAARHPIPLPIILAAVALATLWALLRARNNPALFAACYGFVLLIFVSTNKQAFSNYYFLVAQSFWLAAGAILSCNAQTVPTELSATPTPG